MNAGIAACAVSLLAWSTGPLFIKYLTGYFDSWSQNFYRYLAASLFWLPLLIVYHLQGRLPAAVWRRALLPASMNAVMQTFWALGYYFLNPAFMSLLGKASILWIMLLSTVLFPEERRLFRLPRFWAGLILCAAGVVGVVLSRDDFAFVGTRTGIFVTLLSGVTWALYSVSARAAFRDIDSRIGFAVTSSYTTVGLAVAALCFGRPFDLSAVTPWAWWCVVISGVTSIALAHVFYYAALKRIGITIPAVAILATPFTVLAGSFLVFGERLTWVQCGWGLVLLTGATLAVLAQRGVRDL